MLKHSALGANDDQEDLVFTIKKMIKEEFSKHESKIDEMIKLHLNKILKDVIEITKGLKFTKCTTDEELATVKNDVKKLAFDMKELENNLFDPKKVLQKLTKLEDRS